MWRTDPLIIKAIEVAVLIIWGGFCGGVLWEPCFRAGEKFGRWIEARLFGVENGD